MLKNPVKRLFIPLKAARVPRLLAAALLLLSMLACTFSADLPTVEPQGATSLPSMPPFKTNTPADASTPLPAAPTDPANTGELIQVFFSSPDGQEGENGAVEQAILTDVDQASKSIDIAMYNFSLVRVADALIAAQKRGVQVRMVTESESLDGAQYDRLKAGGIPIIGDQREGLMHNKFMVIDHQVVWTGSLNLTGSGTYNDNNNFERFVSPQLSDNYTVEFEEMFVDHQFGPGSPANTPHPQLEVGGVKLENYFSPDDHISPRLAALVKTAEKSIDFLAYSFTSDPIGLAMLDRFENGVTVRGVFDDQQYHNDTGSEYLRMKRAKMPVWLDGNTGLMHHKVIIIDQQMVVLGSYNFTSSADKNNDENLIILYDPAVARAFESEFARVYAEAQK